MTEQTVLNIFSIFLSSIKMEMKPSCDKAYLCILLKSYFLYLIVSQTILLHAYLIMGRGEFTSYCQKTFKHFMASENCDEPRQPGSQFLLCLRFKPSGLSLTGHDT